MRGEVPGAPMALLVGIALTEVERGRIVFEGVAAEYHYNLGGVAHGGLACTMLDSAFPWISTAASGLRQGSPNQSSR